VGKRKLGWKGKKKKSRERGESMERERKEGTERGGEGRQGGEDLGPPNICNKFTPMNSG
jgi:hypothetical protein